MNIYLTNALGRIYTVHPRNDECIYLRFLLVNVPGQTSFRFLRNVDGELCATYREACQRLHLLEDDARWDRWCCDFVYGTSHQIRLLFAIVISTCFPWSSYNLWYKYKDNMTEDILHRVHSITETYDDIFFYFNCNFILNLDDVSFFSLGTQPVRSRIGQKLTNKFHKNKFKN